MIAIIAVTLFGTLAIAAMLYGMYQADIAENLRHQRDDAEQRARALSKSIRRHLREGIAYQHEVNQLEQRNAYLEQRQRRLMARWWKRRQYSTLSAWKSTGGGL